MIQRGEAKSQAELAQKLQTSRAHVNHYLRLLDLEPEIIQKLESLGRFLDKRIVTERSLRPITRLSNQKQLESFQAMFSPEN